MKTLIATVALLLAGTATAATYTSLPGAPDPGPLPSENLLVDFDSPLPFWASLTGDYWIRTGNHVDHVEPAGNSSQYLVVSSGNPQGNSATLNFSLPFRSVSFYWGSVDTYNFVDVLGAGGATLLSISGTDLPPADGGQIEAETNRRVFFSAGPGETITGLRFSSTGIAFELDDVAGSVPEPETWGLMIAGFTLVGFAMRNRRTAVTAA